ncbi:MAG: type II secretion system major pseudopilin GspG [Gammaproteobacteria bacterium]
MQKLSGQRRHRGFTLIEILVVLVILGLLAGLVGPRLFGKVDSSKVKTAGTQVKMLKTALQTFRLDIGRYPSTEEGLTVLSTRPQGGELAAWAGPYLEEALPVDPWGNPYVYRNEPAGEQEFTLYSLGADGQPGGEGIAADIGYLP